MLPSGFAKRIGLLMLRLPIYSLARAFVIGMLAVGCESRSPLAKTDSAAVSAAASPPLADTVAAKILVASTLIDTAQALPSGDVPALHIPFEERRTVTPGLVVIVKSIRPADTAIIREPSDLRLTLTIERNNKVIYRDTADDGLRYDYYAMPTTKQLYPLWIPTGANMGELLVAFNNRPFKELAQRFFIQNDRIVKIDTLLTFNEPAKDYDHDGKKEFAGFYSYGEEWDDEKGQHRIMYVPTLYYELRSAGLVLDSALTKRKVLAEYGVFQGFEDTGQPGILVQQLPKGSPKRR